jgi:carbon monoxide dehydrogenase subunit G
MEQQGERLIPATGDTTRAARHAPHERKASRAGGESRGRTGDDAFSALVAVKVGPVSARFKGNLKMTNVQAPNSYTINFDGQGGVAGFGKGSADVALTPEGAQTTLKYHARAQVGGKMAQVGSRLIDAAAAKITDDFFKAFEGQLQAQTAGAPAGDALPAPVADSGQRSKMLWWAVAALVVIALIYFISR